MWEGYLSYSKDRSIVKHNWQVVVVPKWKNTWRKGDCVADVERCFMYTNFYISNKNNATKKVTVTWRETYKKMMSAKFIKGCILLHTPPTTMRPTIGICFCIHAWVAPTSAACGYKCIYASGRTQGGHRRHEWQLHQCRETTSIRDAANSNDATYVLLSIIDDMMLVVVAYVKY